MSILRQIKKNSQEPIYVHLSIKGACWCCHVCILCIYTCQRRLVFAAESAAAWLGSQIRVDTDWQHLRFLGRRLCFDVSLLQAEHDEPCLPPPHFKPLSLIANPRAGNGWKKGEMIKLLLRKQGCWKKSLSWYCFFSECIINSVIWDYWQLYH